VSITPNPANFIEFNKLVANLLNPSAV